MSFNFEYFREMLSDQKSYVGIGEIRAIEFNEDNSLLRVKARVVPDQHEVIALVAQAGATAGGGLFMPLSVGDLVVMVFSEGDEDYAMVVGRLTSQDDKMPQAYKENHTVLSAIPDKSLILASNSLIALKKLIDGPDLTENAVLGQALKALLAEFIQIVADMATALAAHIHPTSMGPSSAPTNASSFSSAASSLATLKSSPVEDDKILSKLVFIDEGE